MSLGLSRERSSVTLKHDAVFSGALTSVSLLVLILGQ